MDSEINRLVDKVYVLTIARNADRHPNVQSILKNIPFEFWIGFDAKVNFPKQKYVCDIQEEFFLSNDVDRKFAEGSTIGQFGAYLSIKKMIDHVARSGYNRVLIFEDDMLPLKSNWESILQKALEELPADWDILLAGYLYDGTLYKYSYIRSLRIIVKTYNGLKSFFKKGKIIKRLPAKFTKHLDVSGYSTGGHAFCLSRKGATILSSYLTPMRDSGDLLISRLIVEEKIQAFSVYPCLFIQDNRFASKTKSV